MNKKISFEQSPWSYYADFVLYPIALATGLAVLLLGVPALNWSLLLAAMIGFLCWSPVEYVLHRYVLHGVQPFKRLHQEHHDRPMALIGAPTLLSMLLLVVVVYWPLSFALGTWLSLAATLGLTSGYFFYLIVHHAVHHWKARPGSWLAARKREHAIHHMKGVEGWYGVTTPFWDKVCSTQHHDRSH
ncbi:MAG TPA: sterol desaturase family protein [Castellaniella sp.]|uniref:sterol desaturase family protein n=1 Tax=Castellaniella sp. TaxID=1955812 RepID=UPI002F04CC81